MSHALRQFGPSCRDQFYTPSPSFFDFQGVVDWDTSVCPQTCWGAGLEPDLDLSLWGSAEDPFPCIEDDLSILSPSILEVPKTSNSAGSSNDRHMCWDHAAGSLAALDGCEGAGICQNELPHGKRRRSSTFSDVDLIESASAPLDMNICGLVLPEFPDMPSSSGSACTLGGISEDFTTELCDVQSLKDRIQPQEPAREALNASPMGAQLAPVKAAADGGEPLDLELLAEKLRVTDSAPGRPGSLPLAHEELIAREAIFPEAPSPLALGRDILEQSCWGLDCQTFGGVFEALAACRAFANRPSSGAQRRHFIERRLLPAMQMAGDGGWNLAAVTDGMRQRALEAGDTEEAQICNCLATAMRCAPSHEKRGRSAGDSSSVQFQARAKGTGIVCAKPDGIPAGTFVACFEGEACTPWRWYEKQDTLRRKLGTLPASEQHKAVALERPRHTDSLGYDVVYVDGSGASGVGCRIAHSCKPNCVAVSMSVSGRVMLGIFTTRHVDLGEELTRDHATVTEMEQEYRNSACLCGTSECRGSALYYVNSKSFHEVLSKHHTFLDRTAMLLVACSDELTNEDEARLEDSGVRASVLLDDPCSDQSPVRWSKKWASLLLRYINFERVSLPSALTSKSAASGGMTLERARTETAAIYSNRMHNLAATLDKAKFFLRKQPQSCKLPPLRMLSEQEIISHLWTGSASVANRFVSCFAAHSSNSVAGAAALRSLRQLMQKVPYTCADCRHYLREMASIMGSMGTSHHAAHDCVLLYANTEHFFEPAKYQAITSNIEAGTAADEGSLPAKKAKKPSSSKRRCDTETVGKKYRPGFLWGQMSAWYKQTVRDPSASLSADRRGTVSLPDPESCFSDEALSGKYGTRERTALINHIEHTPAMMWPLQTIWSFKNPSKVYGSPMLDVAIRRMRGDSDHRKPFDELLCEFKNTL